jgi:hypothetical protein
VGRGKENNDIGMVTSRARAGNSTQPAGEEINLFLLRKDFFAWIMAKEEERSVSW